MTPRSVGAGSERATRTASEQRLIRDAAEAQELYGDDELERWADEVRRGDSGGH